MENNDLIRKSTDNCEDQQRGIIENFNYKFMTLLPNHRNLKALFNNNAEYEYIIMVEIIIPKYYPFVL